MIAWSSSTTKVDDEVKTGPSGSISFISTWISWYVILSPSVADAFAEKNDKVSKSGDLLKVKDPELEFTWIKIGLLFTLLFSTNFSDLISIRIAIGSGTAFIVAQLLDVQVFDRLRRKTWFVAPLFSSLIGSTVDTFLFFSISFYGTGVPWITLSLGDLGVKIFIALIMLVPFRLLLGTFKPV